MQSAFAKREFARMEARAKIEEDLFTLMQPRAYATLQGAADAAVEAAVDAIVGALFSVLVTMGVVPILRYPRGGPAQAVAERLKERLHDQLKSHSGGRLFSESHSSGYQRPLLVLFDRAADLGTMVQHCWSYCALCHDVLGMRLNRLTIDEKGEGGAGAATKKTYDNASGPNSRTLQSRPPPPPRPRPRKRSRRIGSVCARWLSGARTGTQTRL